MARAQYSIVYMLAISGILLFLMGALFLMSSSFQKTTTENFGDAILDGVIAQIDASLLELRTLSSGAQNASITVGTPEMIGEQTYLIFANNRSIELRTFGSPSLVKKHDISFWNATLRGSVFPSKGKIQLEFSAANNTVTFK